MTAKRSHFVPECFAYGFLLCGGIVAAQTPDRIRTVDSKITVDRDRTVHVEERLEIANLSGAFDNGIHRRLRIRPAGPERAKAGSFQSVEAKIDGRDATPRLSVDKDLFDIAIGADAGAFSRSSHIVELRYIAKNQFAIYDSYEDFNQDVSGEWPVPLEKATVEVTFPEGFPKEGGVSADTDTESSVPRFDCLQKNLPNGVRFETTHPLAPGERLFISTRFTRGYFVSKVEEDGYRAVLENHPLLRPVLISLFGSIALAGIGIAVWRRAPGRGVTSALPTDGDAPPRFWREVIRVYRFPIIMYVLAIVPGLNFTYSGHGGFGWLLIPLCFPWVIVRILIKIAKGSEASRRWYKTFCKVTIPSYVAISLPLSLAAVTSIRMSFGLPVSTWAFFADMVSPSPWWYFT